MYARRRNLAYFTVGPPKFNTPFLSISPPRHLGRPNRHPIHDRLGRASPPIPLLRSKSTSFQKPLNLGRFLEIVPNWDAKTPHGYDVQQADDNGGRETTKGALARSSKLA